MNPKWQYTTIGKADVKGFNDPGMETFASNPIECLTRESGQNSNDAKDNRPVVIKYKLYSITPDEIPGGKQEIKHLMDQCLSTWKGDKKAETFFNRANKQLSEKEIKVLVISDYNTIGASGSDEDNNSPWFSMVHATGATSKAEGSGGSFGIGKDSFFECSTFRMIFYSTVTNFDATDISFIGRTKLPSYKEADAYISGNVIFGMDKQTAIKDISLVPDFFRRKERGTSVFIIGYSASSDEWEKEIIKGIIKNFYVAIHDEDLVVEVGNTCINKNTLFNLIEKYCIEDEDYTKSYYLAYTSPQSENIFKFEDKLKNLGKVELHVIISNDLPKTVQYMRKNKMVIYESGYKILRLPFAGLFICGDEKGNKFLREMEPPSHDKWEKKRSAKGSLIDNEYKNWIRVCLKQISPSANTEAQDIEELYKWLPFDEQLEENISGDSDKLTGNATKDETILTRLKPSDERLYEADVKESTTGYLAIGEDELGEGGTSISEGQGGNNGTGTGKGSGGSGKGSKTPKKIIDMPVRAFTIANNNGTVSYLLRIRSNKSLKANLLIKAVGEDIEDQVIIQEVIAPNGSLHKFHGSWIDDVELEDKNTSDYKIKIKSKLQLKLKIEIYE